ncbi:MAG TPA: hypothetical protein VFM54_04600 [Micromonosporaceae bacterium]|nr:hypothetical protein [Micromonosporaceae bacterium]
MATYRHTTGDFLRAALPLGLQVRRCEEPRRLPSAGPPPPAPEIVVGGWDGWPWSLMDLVPEAMRAAHGTPSTVIWHFQLAGS